MSAPTLDLGVVLAALRGRRARMIAARIAVVLVAVAGCVLAWRSGGGADGAASPPRPDDGIADAGALHSGDASAATASSPLASPTGATAGSAAAAEGADGYEVVLRLVEVAKDARIDVPSTAHGTHVLASHWRKMRPPWFSASGPAARVVTSIALRTSIIETQWSAPSGPTGKAWSPDATIWNMNEGSFEQRDALIATPPATFTFRVTVPRAAKLTFSEGTVNATNSATLFVITAVDAKGQPHEIHRHRLPPTSARRWTDATTTLDPFAGQTIDLRFTTETSPATASEHHAAARQREAARRAELDAGALSPISPLSPVPVPVPVPALAPGPGTGSSAAHLPDAGLSKEEILTDPSTPVALWGSPTLLARTTPRVPYNVLWIVVDALRPDVIASFHDDAEDAANLAAPNPPLDALLPKVPGLTPAIDDLAKRGVRFTHAYSAGSWTRPGTLAMLGGARSSELGLGTERWVLFPADVARFYASDPPLLPLMLRRRGVSTHAFMNNYFMVGYAPVGVEMGFEHAADHRYRTRDTLEITRDATSWIRANHDTRFFLFVNYNSPHEPYEPPPNLLSRVPPPPAGPADPVARLYMAEAAKDDEAIGVLMQAVADAGLRERTIVVITADHGETLSSAHAGTSALDRMPVRYHHAVSNYEETARVPILIVAPGLLPEDRAVKERVRNTDLAPTLVELLGLEAHARFSGKSLVPLAKGQEEADERVVVTEGRGTRGIMHGRYRLLVREGASRTTYLADKTVTASEELYDLVDDPGERRDLAAARPELVAEMRARLAAALTNTPVAGSAAATAPSSALDAGNPPLRLRFATGGHPRRVSGTFVIGDAKRKPITFTVTPVELGRDALRITGDKAEIALTTSASAPVGFDIIVDPPTTPVKWDLYLDDKPWPEEAVFGGPYGLLAPLLRGGILTDEARLAAEATLLPPIDPRRDVGLFVIRERRGDPGEAREDGDEGAEEMARLLREWGYAHGPATTK